MSTISIWILMSTYILIFRIFFSWDFVGLDFSFHCWKARVCQTGMCNSTQLGLLSMGSSGVTQHPGIWKPQIMPQVGSIQHTVPHTCSPYSSIFLLAFLFLLAPEVQWQIIRRWGCTASAGISCHETPLVGHLPQNMFSFMWLRNSARC